MIKKIALILSNMHVIKVNVDMLTRSIMSEGFQVEAFNLNTSFQFNNESMMTTFGVIEQQFVSMHPSAII